MPRHHQEILPDPQPSNGLKTTEFWKSLMTAVVTLLVGTGVIQPSNNAHTKEIIDSVALIASATVVIGYAISRAITKAAAMKATAVVNSAKVAKMPAELVAESALQPPAK